MIMDINQKQKMIKSADGEWNHSIQYIYIYIYIVCHPSKENAAADAISHIAVTTHFLKELCDIQ